VSEADKGLYVVWRGYQRRAELLGPLLNCRVCYLRSRWKSRWLRPIDYLLNGFATARLIRKHRPAFVVFQSPPPFAALAALAQGVPYVVDAHNAAIQGWWAKLPTSRMVARRALALVAHNQEARDIARNAFTGTNIIRLRDPIIEMSQPEGDTKRRRDQVLIICSFGADEPLEAIHDLISLRPNLLFLITAPTHRLPPQWFERFRSLSNLELTGFLPTDRYQELLLTSGAAVVLTTREATQPSGACEALASDTPLVVSRSSLTENLFGRWAQVVPNDPKALAAALDTALGAQRSLAGERSEWQAGFQHELLALLTLLSPTPRGEEGINRNQA